MICRDISQSSPMQLFSIRLKHEVFKILTLDSLTFSCDLEMKCPLNSSNIYSGGE